MAKGTVKRMIIMLVIAAVVVGAVVGFNLFKTKMIAKAIKGGGIPPQTVSTLVAKTSSWQPTVEALGTLRASEEASLSAEVGGLVTAITFDSGAKVRAGQPLVELNPSPLKAQLAQLEAQAALAEVNLKRDEAQLKVRAIAQAAVDNDAATLKGAQAQVTAQKALIAQKTITAPFSGQLGIRQVNLGQYLCARRASGDTAEARPDGDRLHRAAEPDRADPHWHEGGVANQRRAGEELRGDRCRDRAAGGHQHAQPHGARARPQSEG